MDKVNNIDYHTIFVTHHLYYVPQFIPVAKELKRRGRKVLFLLMGMDSPDKTRIAQDFFDKNNFDNKLYNPDDNVTTCYFMINGAHSFPEINIDYRYSAAITHGIGTKTGYYTEVQNRHDIRFVEGEERVKMIKKLFPDVKSRLYNVGFAKLDEAFNISDEGRAEMITGFNLDPDKKTILYAPTFYPSSIDRMPKNWPADFGEYNIVIKLHFFSYDKKKYRHHLRICERWASYPNVYFAGVDEFNLVPFMTVADIMISDESSAVFEFAALNKPVILNQNVKYRLTYRLFKSKMRNRMDSQMSQFKEIARIVDDYKDLKPAVTYELDNPGHKEEERKRISTMIVGTTDGKTSERIADIMDDLIPQ